MSSREVIVCVDDEEGVLRVAEAVQESIGMGVGVEALSQWEGFGRFCRRHLGVEPLVHPRRVEDAARAHAEGRHDLRRAGRIGLASRLVPVRDTRRLSKGDLPEIVRAASEPISAIASGV